MHLIHFTAFVHCISQMEPIGGWKVASHKFVAENHLQRLQGRSEDKELDKSNGNPNYPILF